MAVWVWHTIEGIPILPAAFPIGRGKEKEFVRGKGSEHVVFRVDGSGQVITEHQKYLVPHDMMGEVGGWMTERREQTRLEPSTDMVLAGGLLGLMVHTPANL